MKDREWAEELKREKDLDRYPKWPNEIMLKVLFGKYLKHNFNLRKNIKVLDVGCFCGNNLFPFASMGSLCYGIDIHEDIIRNIKIIFDKKKYSGNFKVGNNTSIPFPDNTFDLLLSINTIHYESSIKSVENAFEEFKRVLRPKGRILIITVGKNHDIKKKAVKLEESIYKIKDFDFRDGQIFHFFENENSFRKILNNYFNKVEVGEVTEKLMMKTLGFYVGTAEK